MKIKVSSIADPGDLAKERLVLKVLEPADLVRFVISDTTYIDRDHISNELRHIFWFPPQSVSPSDQVVVYTKAGTNSSRREPNGTTTYFYYWNLARTVWNQAQDCAVVFELADWQTSSYRA